MKDFGAGMQASGIASGAQETLDEIPTTISESAVAGRSQSDQHVSFSPGGCEAFTATYLEQDGTCSEEQANLRSTDTFSVERPAPDLQAWESPSLPGTSAPDFGTLRIDHKWGHINPGEDDTSDLNLVEKGEPNSISEWVGSSHWQVVLLD